MSCPATYDLRAVKRKVFQFAGVAQQDFSSFSYHSKRRQCAWFSTMASPSGSDPSEVGPALLPGRYEATTKYTLEFYDTAGATIEVHGR